MADFGYFLLILCCFLSGYGAIAGLAAVRWQHYPLYQSQRMAMTAVFAMCLCAAGILTFHFYARDYSFEYVFKNSSNDLPWQYTLSAFWSSLEGSHFFWTLLLAFYATIAHWTYARSNEHIMPYVSSVLQAVLCWMFYLAIVHSDPFAVMFPVPMDGSGMNVLLQNPYMMFHPPSLFSGYTALTIPFAYALGALLYGDITAGWLRTVRRWTLYGWTFLTIGIFLGGRWAYVELGWGGYWAWDPVENSSLIPWLLATCLLHSLIVQERLGHLKRMSLLLCIFMFFFCFFGTFITRSGIISSVHSFAQSPIGPNYLMYIVGILVVSLGLYMWRAPGILPAQTEKVWGFSRESALVLGQFLLVTMVVTVVIGTLYPVVSEAITGLRFSVQAPYFNSFAPYIGFAMVAAIGLGNLLRFQRQHITGGSRGLVMTLLGAAPLAVGFMWVGNIFYSTGTALVMQIVGSYIAFWCLLCLIRDLVERLRDFRWNAWAFFRRNMAFTGSFVAHVGIILGVLGFLGNYRGLQKTVVLNAGDQIQLFGYEFKFDGIQVRRQENVEMFAAPLAVKHNGRELAELVPARAKYPTSPDLIHEVDLRSTFWHDVYAVLADFDLRGGRHATIDFYLNPTVRFVWWSCLFLVVGGVIALMDAFRGRRSRDHLMAGG